MSRAICLKWNTQPSILQKIKTFFLRDKMLDVTLLCEGKVIKAHKLILAACSQYFQILFEKNKSNDTIVIENDVKYAEIKAIIDFMYEGEVTIKEDNLESLIKAAESLQVTVLGEVQPSSQNASEAQCEFSSAALSRIQSENESDKQMHFNKTQTTDQTLMTNVAAVSETQKTILRVTSQHQHQLVKILKLNKPERIVIDDDDDEENVDDNENVDELPRLRSTTFSDKEKKRSLSKEKQESDRNNLNKELQSSDLANLEHHPASSGSTAKKLHQNKQGCSSKEGHRNSSSRASKDSHQDHPENFEKEKPKGSVDHSLKKSHRQQHYSSKKQHGSRLVPARKERYRSASGSSVEKLHRSSSLHSKKEQHKRSSSHPRKEQHGDAIENIDKEKPSHCSTMKAHEVTPDGSSKEPGQNGPHSTRKIQEHSSLHHCSKQKLQRSMNQSSEDNCKKSSCLSDKEQHHIGQKDQSNKKRHRSSSSHSTTSTKQNKILVKNDKGQCSSSSHLQKVDHKEQYQNGLDPSEKQQSSSLEMPDILHQASSDSPPKKVQNTQNKIKRPYEGLESFPKDGANARNESTPVEVLFETGYTAKREKYFKCRKCDFLAMCAYAVRKHIVTEHVVKKCSLCSFKTYEQQQLDEHEISAHGDVLDVQCIMSTYKYFQQPDLSRYIDITHGNKFKCLICGYIMAQTASIKKHFSAIHFKTQDACKLCSYRGVHSTDLKEHVYFIHEKGVQSASAN